MNSGIVGRQWAARVVRSGVWEHVWFGCSVAFGTKIFSVEVTQILYVKARMHLYYLGVLPGWFYSRKSAAA